MGKKYCKDCFHYIQHYVIFGKDLMTAYCGHCTYPRIKDRKPDTPACGKFTRKYGLGSGGEYRHRRLQVVEH